MVSAPCLVVPLISARVPLISTRVSVYCQAILLMMVSSNKNIFCVTGPEGNLSVTGGFPWQRPETGNFNTFFDLRPNKQSRRRWFETPSRSLWHQCNVVNGSISSYLMKIYDNIMFINGYIHTHLFFLTITLSFVKSSHILKDASLWSPLFYFPISVVY